MKDIRNVDLELGTNHYRSIQFDKAVSPINASCYKSCIKIFEWGKNYIKIAIHIRNLETVNHCSKDFLN